jgi:heme-degrading monooxygenase HmoA
MEIINVLIETVVCSGAPGKEARFKRMLESRQEYKRRQSGCLAAWIAQSTDGQGLFLVHSVFKDKRSWKRISKSIAEKLDTKDGGLEGVFGGPPLVGMFESTLEALNLGVDTQIE